MPAWLFWNRTALLPSGLAVWNPHRPEVTYSHVGPGLTPPTSLFGCRSGVNPPFCVSNENGTLSPADGPAGLARIPLSRLPFGMMSSPGSRTPLLFRSSPSVFRTRPPSVTHIVENVTSSSGIWIPVNGSIRSTGST